MDAPRAALCGRAGFRTVIDAAMHAAAQAGMSVERISVENLLAVQMMSVAARMGIAPVSALRYARPEPLLQMLADLVEAGATSAVRPALVPGQRSSLPVMVCGRLVEALAQAVKFAVANHDERIADHAVDLVSELGAALRQVADGADAVTAASGVFTEAASLLDEVAARLDGQGWSTCPCGQHHGQEQQSAAVVPHLRADADLARMIAAAATNATAGRPAVKARQYPDAVTRACRGGAED